MAKLDRLEVIEKVVSCRGCELVDQCSGPVAFTGPNPCSIAIIGEAPGAQEDDQGRPFIGPAGELLRQNLRENDIDPDECFILNTVSCFPHGTPQSSHIAACRNNKLMQLELADPTWVLMLGGVALKAVDSRPRIGTARGRPFQPGGSGPVYYAAYHPAAALRKGEFAKAMAEDLARFAKMVGDGIEGWQKYLVDGCWECKSDEVAWVGEDWTEWCEKHAPPEYHERIAFVEAMSDPKVAMVLNAFPGYQYEGAA